MIALKYDDAIKRSRDVGYDFGIFWKILCSKCFFIRNWVAQGLSWDLGQNLSNCC